MTDDGELPEPEDEFEEDIVVFFRNEVVPTVHGLINSIQVQIDTFDQFVDRFVRTLVILKFPPENAFQSNPEPTSDLDHGLLVNFNFITQSFDCAV